jgi:hypothetical protein
MYTPVPEVYEQLLEHEMGTVSFSEVETITAMFESKTAYLQGTEGEGIDDTLAQARSIRTLLDQPDKLTDRQLLTALAALQYFVRDEDHAHGHDDDAMVIQAAVNHLREPLQALQT